MPDYTHLKHHERIMDIASFIDLQHGEVDAYNMGNVTRAAGIRITHPEEHKGPMIFGGIGNGRPNIAKHENVAGKVAEHLKNDLVSEFEHDLKAALGFWTELANDAREMTGGETLEAIEGALKKLQRLVKEQAKQKAASDIIAQVNTVGASRAGSTPQDTIRAYYAELMQEFPTRAAKLASSLAYQLSVYDDAVTTLQAKGKSADEAGAIWIERAKMAADAKVRALAA
jgi:hypothetical protein